MITIALLNQKGGVGKTSLTCHLAGALADLGDRVLAVDLDPQSSLTQGRIGPEAAARVPPDRTSYAIAAGLRPDPLGLAIDPDEAGWDLIPGSPALAECNAVFAARRATACPHCGLAIEAPDPGEAVVALRHSLAELAMERPYRYCLLDCPPNLQRLSAMALAAAEFLVIPMQPEDYGAQGLKPVLGFMRLVSEHNPALQCAGIVVNMRKRLSLHTLYVEQTRKEYGGLVFDAVVPELVGFKEAIAARESITRHDPRSNAAEAMRALAAELIRRTGGDLP